ncbi:transposon TX1 [Tanacetum coccineum]
MYGFVRFKFRDFKVLLMRLRKIRIREECTRILFAYDKRNTGNISMDILKFMGEKSRRIIEIGEDEFNDEVINKSVIGEVKKLHYLPKLLAFYEEQGLNKVEVKLLGGLEVMIVLDAPETVSNILKNNDHGIRRWLDNLRRWNKFYAPSGKLIWVNIIVVPVSCWTEMVFRKIAEAHGSIARLCNCKLEGNQNTIIGRVQIQSLVNGLINETMKIKFRGIIFNVKVIEEVSDITEVEVEEVKIVNMEEQADKGSNQKNDGEDMLISEDDEEDGESNNGSNGKDDAIR